jgi:ABC-type bacteriocin/lantibiotic exporter with double-glycine peptidase domain
MAELTMTRPQTGSTLIRALEGLNHKLEGRGIRAVALEPEWDEMRTLPTPMLTPLRVSTAQDHMVTILKVKPDGVWMADPTNGLTWVHRDDFLISYTNRVIAFAR